MNIFNSLKKSSYKEILYVIIIMNINKISKKGPHEDNRMTMLAIHENKINEIKEYYKTLPDKEKQLQYLLKKQKSVKIIELFQINKQIEKLSQEIENIKNKTELSEYLMKATFYLKEYKLETSEEKYEKNEEDEEDEEDEKKDEKNDEKNEENEIFDEKEEIVDDIKIFKSNKGKISTNYIQNCLSNNFTISDKINDLKCCDTYRIINLKEAIAICKICGSTINYQSIDTCNEFSEEIEVLSPFSYKKINHLKEWISMALARETSSPPQEVIDILLLELKKNRITDKNQVTHQRIKQYLKKNGLNKMYEHIPSIIYKITGKHPLVISRELENKLLKMFDEMQIPYNKHKPKNRKNFLSYSYCLHKLFQILGEDELAQSFELLKSRDKLYEQDKLFEKICIENSWKFIPSV